MADNEGKNDDLYGVLGLNKECTPTDLKIAYKKLALKWHPDRCSASGNLNFAEEAKKKFQDIQHAYSVLSDGNKRFLYDVGGYDSDDVENGMGDFLSEMAAMMSQTKPSDNGESFEELQVLFDDIFHADVTKFGSRTQPPNTSTRSSSSYVSCCENSKSSSKRNSSGMTKTEDPSGFESHYQNSCSGSGMRAEYLRGEGSNRRNSKRRQQ